MIDLSSKEVSLRSQCDLLGLSRSTLYYKAVPETDFNLSLMNLIDEEFTRRPFYGVPKMTDYLRRQGHTVNPKRIRRLMRKMGLEAVCPGPNMSKRNYQHKIYPYLLKGLVITRPNQVWCADITYIRLLYGFVYLVVIMDWYSRYVLSWRVSNTLDTDFCLEALEEALTYGRPDIFNTDQGSQFTSADFITRLEKENVAISMDSRGRAFDNIFVERLWRTVKYENVYLNGYQNIPETKIGLSDYFTFYNNERSHQSLDYKTPWEVYAGVLELSTESGVYQHMPLSEKMQYNANVSNFSTLKP